MSDAGNNGEVSEGDTRGPAIQTVQIFMILLAFSAVALRFLSRHLAAAALLIDDWTIVLAAFLSFAINIINLVGEWWPKISCNDDANRSPGVRYGMGHHIQSVPDSGHKYLMTLFALEITYPTALAITKIGVLLMYRRLFGIDQGFSRQINAVLVLVVLWWIGVEITTLVQCRPIYKFWDYQTPGECSDVPAFFEGAAIVNVLTDLIILLLPQPIIWKLRLNTSARIGLCCIFLLGALTACASIGRLVAMLLFRGDVDFTWNAYAVIICYSVEPPVGIVCACLPCLGPLFRMLPGSPFVTTVKSSISYASGQSRGQSLQATFWRSERRPSDFDTDSVAGLRPATNSGKNSVLASARPSFESSAATGAGYEMNVIHSRLSATEKLEDV